MANLRPRKVDLLVGNSPKLSRAKNGEQSERLTLGNTIFNLKQGVTIIKLIRGLVGMASNVSPSSNTL